MHNKEVSSAIGKKMRNKKLLLFVSLGVCLIVFSSSIIWGNQRRADVQNIVPEDNSREMQDEVYLSVKPYSRLILREKIDLNGKNVKIPRGVIIEPRGGLFFNGQLIGDSTIIEGQGCLFEKVKISGEWIVPEISTSMFNDLSEVNSLQDVIALASDKIFNYIVIEKGSYNVTAPHAGGALIIPSNTRINIEGNIYLKPNDYPRCYVIYVPKAENVIISGNGTIWGDKMDHTGSDGEWGHGIYIAGSQNVTVINLSIKNCWGDCIYIGSKSKNINICNCTLENGRRQGVSVTSAKGVRIEDCHISNVSGCKPGLGIDIEPNKDCTVDDVTIKNVRIENCFGGISTGGHETARLGRVAIDNCVVVGTEKKLSFVFSKAEKVTITNCTIDSDDRIGIKAVNVGDVSISNNIVRSNHKVPILVKNCDKQCLKENIISGISR